MSRVIVDFHSVCNTSMLMSLVSLQFRKNDVITESSYRLFCSISSYYIVNPTIFLFCNAPHCVALALLTSWPCVNKHPSFCNVVMARSSSFRTIIMISILANCQFEKLKFGDVNSDQKRNNNTSKSCDCQSVLVIMYANIYNLMTSPRMNLYINI